MIKGKIDVTKIDKSALFKGKKGTYLDIALIETPNSKYSDTHMIVQDIGKERRDAGEKGPILGNARDWAKQAEPDIVRDRPASAELPDDEDSSFPF